jgi:cell division protein FtsB
VVDKAPRVPYRGHPRPSEPDAAPTPAEHEAEAPTEAIPLVPPRAEDEGTQARTAPRDGAASHGGRRARTSVADGARRLRERLALEGAIHDPGDDARPAPTPRAAGPERPTPARALSTRVITLSIILIICGFTLFPATTTYLRQQSELNAARAELAEEQATEERLTDELKRWDDPEYVKQQARERIGMAVPGEKQYVNVGEPKTSQRVTTVEPGEYRQGLPWGDGLWDSVMRASKP